MDVWNKWRKDNPKAKIGLRKANLSGADLRGANLQKAKLIGTLNLTIKQLSLVKTLYQAKLDPKLIEQVKNCCPHLLEKPKEDQN